MIFWADHVGDLAKVAIHQKVAAGRAFTNSDEMVDYLDNKFKGRSDPTFCFKTIDCSVLDEERASVKLKDFETVDGSSSSHAIVKLLLIFWYQDLLFTLQLIPIPLIRFGLFKLLKVIVLEMECCVIIMTIKLQLELIS